MSEKEAINETMEGAMELVEVPNNNTLAKVTIAGTLVLVCVAVVMYFRNKKKSNTVESEVVEVKTKNSNKNEK